MPARRKEPKHTASGLERSRSAPGDVGYPFPSTPSATAIMKANPSKNTRPELRLRTLLHACGLRYRTNYPIRAGEGRPILVDVAFTRLKLAIFMDGCFWHACPIHGSVPKANVAYWSPKLERTVERDRETTARLELAGWSVLRFWEHEEPREVCSRIAEAVAHPETSCMPSQ